MSKFLPLLALALAVPLSAEDAADPIKALTGGKASLELRTRYEHVQDDGASKSADALTNRLVLGYKTASFMGLSAFAQFENVANLGEPRYFVPQTGYGKSDHAVIADPQVSQVNQLYLDFRGFKVGRQIMNLDNQRFIGSVAWRQNDQSFTGASYAREFKWVNVNLAHFTKVHNIFGQTKPITADVAAVNVKLLPGANLRAFYTAFNEGDQATIAAGVVTKDTSFAHAGARLDGEFKGLLYDASFANQKRYKDATANGTLEVKYSYLGLGYKFTKDLSVMAAQERLEGGFKTPYATLHAWNGWADRFLTTPANGLVDSYAQFKGKWGAWGLDTSYHAYKADTNGAKYGTELDLAVDYKAASWLTLLAKVAAYSADSATPTLGTPNKDLKKVWLQTVLKF